MSAVLTKRATDCGYSCAHSGLQPLRVHSSSLGELVFFNINMMFAFKVKHYWLNRRVCLGIFSSCPLPKGAEITIPFEFPFDEYRSSLDCPCRQEMCAVMKYNIKFQSQNHDGHAHKRLKPHDEDSNSGSVRKMSPLRVSLANSHGLQVRAVAESCCWPNLPN